jgi:hypothetical protein
MALYNLVTKQDIQQSACAAANEIERSMLRWKYFADKINTISGEDLTALGLDADYQAYLSTLRVAILNLELLYRHQTPLNSDDPSYVVKLFAQLNVV